MIAIELGFFFCAHFVGPCGAKGTFGEKMPLFFGFLGVFSQAIFVSFF